MVNHVRKHTGETPHRCDICKKSFTRKEHFMNHVMWHTGETPHHCQVCGKKYTRKEHLANHMRSHTNDTPFRCEICGKSLTFLHLIVEKKSPNFVNSNSCEGVGEKKFDENLTKH